MRTGYVVAASALCLVAVGAVTAVLTTGVGGANPATAGGGNTPRPVQVSETADSAEGVGPGVARIFAESADWRLAYRLDCGSGSGASAVEFQVHAASGALLLTLDQAVAVGSATGTGRAGWQVLSVAVTNPNCDWRLATSPAQVTTTPSQP